jgi:hypothetical protein
MIYSNGRFHARLETDTGDWLDTTVKKLCPLVTACVVTGQYMGV